MKKFLILDCFVDEPACFGVPPFISPYPRYIFGALIDAGINPDNIKYYTIDHLRDNSYRIEDSFHMVFLIGGAIVPGKYLGSRIGTVPEIEKIITLNPESDFAIGGLISSIIRRRHGNITLIGRDIEKYAHSFARGFDEDSYRSTGEIARWSRLGSELVQLHPSFPDIICEIETYRGCPREKHCSFCSEGLFKNIEFRKEGDILCEIDDLINNGVSRFRLGRQADILQYKSSLDHYYNGFPRPEVTPVSGLFGELRTRRESGKISVLNIDNANPGTIINFPEESSRILEAIVDAITPGDTLPLGIESFDPEVIRLNNLKVSGDEAVRVVKIINDIGGRRINGIPILLPGINLIHGLKGESATTFKENHHWLMQMKDMGLLLKRINIRKLLPFPGTGLFSDIPRMSAKTVNRFEYYRSKIRHDIDTYMLREIYPLGTILHESHILDEHNGYSLGKQISSYSITTKYPLLLQKDSFQESIVIGHRERSLLAHPAPYNVNSLPQKAFEMIPGISRKPASDIILARPFKNTDDFKTFLKKDGITINKKITDASTV